MSGKVSAAVQKAIGPTPLFVKIGYLHRAELAEFVRYNRNYIQGIVAINTISMPVVTPAPEHSPVFPGRVRAGISGAAIRKWAFEVVSNLVSIRRKELAEDDFAIIALGGVSTPQDIYDYLNLGADAVGSCTAAYLNPLLAMEARLDMYHHVNGNGKEVKITGMERREGRGVSRDIYQPSRDQIGTVQTKVLLGLYENGAKLSLDKLAESFKDGLRPSNVEVAHQFGALIRHLEDEHLIERELDLERGLLSYKLTGDGRREVEQVLTPTEAHQDPVVVLCALVGVTPTQQESTL